ncbi:MAG: DUF433 domain-containing protein [Solirubrobacterales bacterium]|nr:DUF433 domain-containing protein [Solirubrobacterales bacterium]
MPAKTASPRNDRRRTRSARERCSFNRREAAYFADVSVRQVDKAIEEKVVRPWRPDVRLIYLDRDDVVTIAVLAKTGLQLPKQTKRQIHKWVRSSFEERPVKHRELSLSNILVLRLDPAIVSMADQLDAYRERRERYISSDLEIQGGEPVIAGTRLPVSSVATRLDRGDSLDDLAADYPGIPKTAFEAARIYADAHPRRGRPARPWRDG